MDNQNNVTQLEKLKLRIPYNAEIHISEENYESILISLLEDSENIGLSLKYPYDGNKNKLPERYNNWQIRCCLELYKMAGTKNVQSYSENGLRWTMFRNGLSLDLINEITACIGFPKEKSSEEDV